MNFTTSQHVKSTVGVDSDLLNLKTVSAMISLTPCPGLNSVLSILDISTAEVFGQELLGPLTALGYLNDFLFILLCDRIFQVGVKYSYRLTFR